MGSGNSGDILCTNKVGTLFWERSLLQYQYFHWEYLINHSVIGGDFINCTSHAHNAYI